MDNLTHSLIGAALGQAGLKRRTGLAMPALILAANLPDIDAPCAIYGVESLSMRRGLTHGPIALAILPLLLAGALWWFDRWQTRRGKRPEGRLPVDFKWLLALCTLGALTHPLFDWFNNYGIRLLEPFSSQWFYGDTLFIIDPWILAMLGAGVWLSLRRERAGRVDWTRPAQIGLVGLTAFVFANTQISALAVRQMRAQLQLRSDSSDLVVANAVPLAFWRRELLYRTGDFYGSADFSLTAGATPRTGPAGSYLSHSVIRSRELASYAANDSAVRAFLFWSRMPVTKRDGDRLVLRDQRFLNNPVGDQFSVSLRAPAK